MTRVRGATVRLTAAAAVLGAVLAAASPARSQDIGYTASMALARGTYPGERVTGVYVFNTVDVTHGRLRAAVTAPFIRQRVAFLDLADPAAPAETATGFGDPLIRVDVALLDDRARGLQIAAAGSIKLPLRGADSLGTGEADVGAGASLFKAAGRTSIFADVLFWKYGDPEGVDFEDSVSYSIGVGRVIGSGRWSALASLSGFSTGLDGATPPMQLTIALLTLAGERQSLAITGGAALNESAGDFSFGVSWRIVR